MRSLRLGVFALFAFSFLFAVLNPTQAYADSSSAASSVVADHVGDEPMVASDVEQSDERSAVTKLLDALPDWLQALSLLIAAAAGIAALTPSPKDDSALAVLRKIIDLLALNFGGAKNANRSKTDKYLS